MRKQTTILFLAMDYVDLLMEDLLNLYLSMIGLKKEKLMIKLVS
jgi:hypothetical protein